MDASQLRSRVRFWTARTLTSLPTPLLHRLSGAGPIRIDGNELSPQVQLLLAAQRRMGSRGLSDLPPVPGRVRMRRESMFAAGTPPAVASVRDLPLELTAPGRTLAARHYRCGRARAPLLVYFHGGGFVLGDLDSHDAPCRWICLHGGVDVLSVAYRLAPEHPFPAGVDDALAAYRWARAHAAELGADPSRIAVGGDSAGGNLAAVVAQAARGAEAPALQVLLYPMVEADSALPSKQLFAEGFVLTRKDIGWFGEQYTGGRHHDDPRVSPSRGQLMGLAPALVVTAGFDPLRDEGEAYANALRQAGSQVELRRFAGLVHGFIHLVGVSDDCAVAMRAVGRAVQRLLDARPAAAGPA
jgi:acetyl esterase